MKTPNDLGDLAWEILTHAPDGIVLVDNGKIKLVNNQACTIFKYSEKELLGADIETLIPKRFKDAHIEHRLEYVENPHTRPMGIELTLHGVRSDGVEFPVEISLAPIRKKKGLVAAIIRDVTERKKLEEQTEKIKDEFFALVSHELRTPLTTIIGYVDLLELWTKDQLNSEAQRALQAISDAAVKEEALVDDFLVFARIERDQLPIDRASSDPKVIVTNTIRAFAQQAKNKGLDLKVDIQDDIPIAWIDSSRLGQALDNLVGNAIKFTDSGIVEIRLFSEQNNLIFEVRDTGPGIPKEDLPHIFERLYRASSSTEAHIPGTGLGLTIVKAIVESHHGRVSVDSKLGQGSTFRITIPMMSKETTLNSDSKEEEEGYVALPKWLLALLFFTGLTVNLIAWRLLL